MRILFTIILWAFTQGGLKPTTYRGEGGLIAFTSDAPLELIKARSKSLKGIVNAAENTFAFLVPTATFQGFNSPLQQEHFHENYMESGTYQIASFSGKFIEKISDLKEGKHSVRAKGDLKIHGQTVERIVKCKVEVAPAELHIQAQFMVPLSDHQIDIPRVVNQKIAENIAVTVDITLKPAA